MKRASSVISVVVVFLLAEAALLFGQPSWTDFTYTDWNPGVAPAIAGDSSNPHYESRTVWDGARFVNIHERDQSAPVYDSLWICYSGSGQSWSTPAPINVPRTWDVGHHAVACNPHGFPTTDTMNGDENIKFKLWYAKYGGNYHYRYAESTDGVNWTAAVEPSYCPPHYKVSDCNPGGCGTTKVMIKPDVLYRPDGSGSLDTANPMNNRYVMYLGSSHGSICSGDPGFFEMYISSNGLDDWALYAWDQECQNRWDTFGSGAPEVKDIVTFSGCSNPSNQQYVDSIEEVYRNGERKGFMLWTHGQSSGPIYSYYSINGVDWICREDPISAIGSTSSNPLAWNFSRNYNFDSVRMGEGYLICRSGEYNLGMAVSGEMTTPTPAPTPTATPTPLPNYINLETSPASVSHGGTVVLSWRCDFSRWNYRGIPVDIYLAAVENPEVSDGPSTVIDAVKGDRIYFFGPGLFPSRFFRGPAFRWVRFPPAPLSGTVPFNVPRAPLFGGDWKFATAFLYPFGVGPVRDDGLPVENSNIFSIR